MAKISLSDEAPQEAVHVVLGTAEFDLADHSAVYETDDVAVIGNAGANPWLNVEIDPPVTDPTQQPDYDPNDPHDNPSADHLSVLASDEAVAAAASNEEAIRHAAGLDDPTQFGAPDSEDPTVSESIDETFNSFGVVTDPVLPVDPGTQEPQPVTPADPGKPDDPGQPAPPAPVGVGAAVVDDDEPVEDEVAD